MEKPRQSRNVQRRLSNFNACASCALRTLPAFEDPADGISHNHALPILGRRGYSGSRRDRGSFGSALSVHGVVPRQANTMGKGRDRGPTFVRRPSCAALRLVPPQPTVIRWSIGSPARNARVRRHLRCIGKQRLVRVSSTSAHLAVGKLWAKTLQRVYEGV